MLSSLRILQTTAAVNLIFLYDVARMARHPLPAELMHEIMIACMLSACEGASAGTPDHTSACAIWDTLPRLAGCNREPRPLACMHIA